jgi:hypothetical protein
VRNAADFFSRTIRAVKFAATDKRIPKPLRWLAALGLAPIPGPFDEALLLIVAIPLALFYREPLANAWTRAGFVVAHIRSATDSTRLRSGGRSINGWVQASAFGRLQCPSRNAMIQPD